MVRDLICIRSVRDKVRDRLRLSIPDIDRQFQSLDRGAVSRRWDQVLRKLKTRDTQKPWI
jgi:hypothetical protein